MSIEKVIELYQDYHWEGELRMLNRIADGIHDGVIVAIGSYRGQADGALALHAHVPVYCIDPRNAPGTHYGDVDRPYWMENILFLNIAEKVRPVNLPSLTVAKIWDQPISLLFVDGNHFEVEQDLEAWLPFVTDKALVILHDNNMPEVVRAAEHYKDHLELVEVSDLTSVYRFHPAKVTIGSATLNDDGSWSRTQANPVQDNFTIHAEGTVSWPEHDNSLAAIVGQSVQQQLDDEIMSIGENDPLDTPVLSRAEMAGIETVSDIPDEPKSDEVTQRRTRKKRK